MEKIEFNNKISKDKLLELTANKVQELVGGYNFTMEKLRDILAWKDSKEIEHIIINNEKNK